MAQKAHARYSGRIQMLLWPSPGEDNWWTEINRRSVDALDHARKAADPGTPPGSVVRSFRFELEYTTSGLVRLQGTGLEAVVPFGNDPLSPSL